MDGFLAFLGGVFVNECGEVSRWASREVAHRGAVVVFRDPEQARLWADKHCAYLAAHVPGKATWLLLTLLFVGVLVAGAVWRSRAKDRVFIFFAAKMRALRRALFHIRREVMRLRARWRQLR
ncbi:hypothetical protein ACWDRB_63410 [Nonomuraea sp. NPDC003707]